MRIKYSEICNFQEFIIEDYDESQTKEIHEVKRVTTYFDPLDFTQEIPRFVPVDECTQDGSGLCELPDDCPAKLIKAGKMIEIITSRNSACGKGLKNIRTLSGNRYLNLETGVVRMRKRNKSRIEAISSLNNSIRELRYLIHSNFCENGGLFITLAYDYFMDNYETAQ